MAVGPKVQAIVGWGHLTTHPPVESLGKFLRGDRASRGVSSPKPETGGTACQCETGPETRNWRHCMPM
eukprot:1192595-Prorocentrum_minimum.AAC.5